MCGIVGYVGRENALNVLIDGLSKLEYRGYDSAGVAVCTGGKVEIAKVKGKIENLVECLKVSPPGESVCGIGHTRWATHGVPSQRNSHPHSGNNVTLVHNGIIENYVQLKNHLLKEGQEFSSETDTEVAAKLIGSLYNGDPIATIKKAVGLIEGSYAFGIMFSDRENEIYALRKDSPLIVGLGEGENFIASDVPAILKYTKRYYLLEENEIAHLTQNGVRVTDLDGNAIEKTVNVANWDIESAEKSGYPHFMLKEIAEQPKAVRDTIKPRIRDGLPDFSCDGLDEDALRKYNKIHIVACGTAMHAGIVGKYLIESLARIDVATEIASEFRYKDPILHKDDLVIVISQSGETADTLAALRLAKDSGVDTLAIVNVVGSSIARKATHIIYTWAGPEIAVASTKAYTVQLSVMYLLAVKLALLRGSIDTSRAKEIINGLTNLCDAIEKVTAKDDVYHRISKLFSKSDDLFFLGRGIDYAIAMEGSLKLKEISYIHSEAYAAGELKHGTISLITEGTPVIALCTQERLFEKMLSNVKEVKSRGAFVIAVCKEGMQISSDAADVVLSLPAMEDILMPILTVAPLQLIAYHTAVERGCDVDKPRNLAKAVTVE